LSVKDVSHATTKTSFGLFSTEIYRNSIATQITAGTSALHSPSLAAVTPLPSLADVTGTVARLYADDE